MIIAARIYVRLELLCFWFVTIMLLGFSGKAPAIADWPGTHMRTLRFFPDGDEQQTQTDGTDRLRSLLSNWSQICVRACLRNTQLNRRGIPDALAFLRFCLLPSNSIHEAFPRSFTGLPTIAWRWDHDIVMLLYHVRCCNSWHTHLCCFP